MNRSLPKTAAITIGVVLAALFALIGLSAVAAHVTELGQQQQDAQPVACADSTGADTAAVAQKVQAVLAGRRSNIRVEGLTEPQEQIPNAETIVATGMSMNVPARGQIIALATALQESGLRNIGHGDRDSLGLFQQRPSQNWGTPQQLLDPVYASKKFYERLKRVNGWEQLPLTVAAQRVQRSGFPDAYAKHEPLATALQQAIASSLGSSGETSAGLGAAGALPAGTACGGEGSNASSPYEPVENGKLPKGYSIPANATPEARAAIGWALQQLGGPYQWGGSCTNPKGPVPRDRCDCSSLMQRAYGVAGVTLTRTTYTQVNEGQAVPTSEIQPGDLVFTRGTAARPEHVALAIGRGLVVNAPRPGRGIEVAELSDHGQVLVVRRVI